LIWYNPAAVIPENTTFAGTPPIVTVTGLVVGAAPPYVCPAGT
jgi:hypothetical protein